jgi:hypothetical protein
VANKAMEKSKKIIDTVAKNEFIEKSVKVGEEVATQTLDALEAIGEKALHLFVKEVLAQIQSQKLISKKEINVLFSHP